LGNEELQPPPAQFWHMAQDVATSDPYPEVGAASDDAEVIEEDVKAICHYKANKGNKIKLMEK